MTAAVTETQRALFVELYRTDSSFHHEVDRLLWAEVDDLREDLRAISNMRREDFLTAWHYEVEVRKTADHALRRLRKGVEL